MPVLYRKEDGVAYITLNRPQALNALNAAMRDRLREVWDDFDDDDALSVAVLSGAGRAFCAGMDLKEAGRTIRGGGRVGGARPQAAPGRIADTFQVSKPVICAVNGPTAGGGLTIALSADIVICSEVAQFVMPMVARGLNPGPMALLLARRVNPNWAAWMLYSAQRIDATTALNIGLVMEVLPPDELLPRAQEMAERIRAHSQLAIRATKERLHRYYYDGYRAALGSFGPYEQALVDSYDAHEGIIAFNEKRRARFDEPE